MSLEDIVVDGDDNVYVRFYDGLYKIKKYSSAGVYLNEYIPESGVNAFCFSNNYLYILNSGGLYKLDTSFNIISYLSSSFEFFVGGGLSVAVSDSGKIFCTYYNGSYCSYIARISASFEVEQVSRIGNSFDPQPTGLQFYNNSLYTILYNYPYHYQNLIKINPNFSEEILSYETIGELIMGGGNFSISNGFVYAVSSGDNCVYKYNLADVNYVGSFLGGGSGDGQVSGPTGIFIK